MLGMLIPLIFCIALLQPYVGAIHETLKELHEIKRGIGIDIIDGLISLHEEKKDIILDGIHDIEEVLGLLHHHHRPSSTSCQPCSQSLPCKDVVYENITLAERITYSPFYGIVALRDYETKNVDNVCVTFFPIDATSYFMIRLIVRSDKQTILHTFIVADIPGSPGTYTNIGLYGENGDTTRVSVEYTLQEPRQYCNRLWPIYRCPLFDQCKMLKAKEEFRLSHSTKPKVSECCLNRTLEAFVSQGFVGDKFHVFPQKFPMQCVTRFNKIPCINIDKVDPSIAISLP